jgi:hypothetical protein
MKLTLISISCILIIHNKTYAQAIPSGTSNPGINWHRGGNTIGAGANIFGTATGFNSPIFTITNGVNRTRLNGTVGYPVNGFAGIRDGFFLLGQDDNVAGGTLYGTAARGAFSLLHLNGNNSTGFAQELGYRPWMQTGITLTENNDRAYFGYRSILGEANDLVLNWSDNAFGPSPGPDNLVFNFTTSVGPALPSGNTADLFGDDLDGREIMRLTGFGNVGIGPRFNNTFQPTSTLHQHQENAANHT